MTANELRIGNYIIGPFFGDGEPKHVTAADIGNIVKYSEEIKGVPLSKEWLARAGFDKRIIRIDRHSGEDWFDISTVMVNDDVDNPEWRYLFTMNGESLIVVQYLH